MEKNLLQGGDVIVMPRHHLLPLALAPSAAVVRCYVGVQMRFANKDAVVVRWRPRCVYGVIVTCKLCYIHVNVSVVKKRNKKKKIRRTRDMSLSRILAVVLSPPCLASHRGPFHHCSRLVVVSTRLKLFVLVLVSTPA